MTDDQRAIAAIKCPVCHAPAGRECRYGVASDTELPTESAPGLAHRQRLRAWHDEIGSQNPSVDPDRGTGVLEVRKRCVAFTYDSRGRATDEGEVWLEAGTIITGVSDTGDLAVSGEHDTWFRPLDGFNPADDLITAAQWSEEVRWLAMHARATAAMPAPAAPTDTDWPSCLASSLALGGWLANADKERE